MARDADWDRVWAEYDARRPAPVAAPPSPAARPMPVAAPRPPRRPWRWLLAAAAMLLPAIWVAAPGAAAWQVARAVETLDADALARHLDTAAVQARLRDSLRHEIAAPLGGPAAAFLGAMAEEVAQALADPAALAQVARLRAVQPGAGPGLFRVQPLGLTRFDLPVGDGVAPLTLRFELTDLGAAPRWQVTQVLAGTAAPAAAPAAPGGFSLR